MALQLPVSALGSRGVQLALALLAVFLGPPARAQSVVLTEAFADRAGRLHFAVTKVLRVEGTWLRYPLDVGTIIEPPSVRRAHPLRRFGETVLFVLPEHDNLRAYWSYNVHDGFVPGVEGRPLSQVISLLVPPADVRGAPSPEVSVVSALPRERRRAHEFEEDMPREKNTGSHELMAEALRQLTTSPTQADLKVASVNRSQRSKK